MEGREADAGQGPGTPALREFREEEGLAKRAEGPRRGQDAENRVWKPEEDHGSFKEDDRARGRSELSQRRPYPLTLVT